MKWILAILLLISASAIGQTEDSTKYIWYKAQYGQRMPRGWWDSVAHMPYYDTTGVRPSRPGAIMMRPTDKKFYGWDGTNWALFTGPGATLSNVGSGLRPVKTPSGQVKSFIFGYGVNGDSTTNTDAITVQADTSETNHLVTQSDLNDTAAVLRAAIGTGSGTPAGSNKQIQVNGLGAFAAEAGFEYDFSTNKFTADTVQSKQVHADSIKVANKIIINPDGKSYAEVWGVGELGPGVYVKQIIENDGLDINEHGIIDGTLFKRANKAYASFDAQPIFTGVNFDHYAGAQIRAEFQHTGTINNVYMLYSRPLVSGSGTITNLYHTGVPIDYTMNGHIGNEYGFYCRTLKGDGNKYAIYTQSDVSHFGGNIEMGANGSTYPITINKDGVTLVGDWANVAQFANAAGTAGINMGYDDSDNDGIISSQSVNSGIQLWTHNGTSFGERIRIAHNGNLGINTTNPGRQLTINGNGPNVGWYLNDVEKAIVSIANGADNVVTGSSTGDMCWRTVDGQRLLLSFNEGDNAHAIFSATGLQINGDVTVDDDAYDASGWNGNNEVPTKNAIRDKIESMSSGGIMSINSQTGSSQTIAGANDIDVTTTTNTVTISKKLSDQAHTSGTSVTISTGVTRLFVDPTTALASLDITMPSSPYDGQTIEIYFGGTISGSSLDVVTGGISSWSTPSSGFVPSPPISSTPIKAGTTIIFKYRSANSKWYQIK